MDQYQPAPPGGQLHSGHTPGGVSGQAGGENESAGGSTEAAGGAAGENSGGGPSGAAGAEVQSGGSDGSLPFTGGYPATSLVLIVLALVAAGIGVRVGAAGYQRLRLRRTGSTAS